MLRKLKEILVGVALVSLLYFLERSILRREDAAERTAFRKGKDGAAGGHPRSDTQPTTNREGLMEQKRFELPYWVWLILFALGLYLILAVGRAQAQDIAIMAKRNVYISSDWGHGSGFIYKKDTVVTAAHLLGPNMKANGKDAVPVAIDTEHDILLLVTQTERLPDLHFNLVPTPLMPVIAIGNPLDKRNFISLGYVGWANGEIINTSNVVMMGYSGAGAYDSGGKLIGMVVAGEGNCVFGYTIDRLVSAKRLLLFLFDRPKTDVEEVLRKQIDGRASGEETSPRQCPDKAPTTPTQGGSNANERQRPPSEGNGGGDVQRPPRRGTPLFRSFN